MSEGINMPDISLLWLSTQTSVSINHSPWQIQFPGAECYFSLSFGYSSSVPMPTSSMSLANVRTLPLVLAPMLTHKEAIQNKVQIAMRKAMQMAETAHNEIEKDSNTDIQKLRSWFFRDQDLPRVKSKLAVAVDKRYILTQSPAPEVYSSMQKYKEIDTPDTDDLKQPVSSVLESNDRGVDLGSRIIDNILHSQPS